jgi:hypothetical protein
MSSDFRVKSGYFSNLKIMKLEHRFGSDAVLGHLRLIEYCAVNKPDGIFEGMDADDIEMIAHWQGESGEFFAMLLSLSLIDEIAPGLYAMHDWEEHNPYVAGSKSRSEIAHNAAIARWNKKHEADRLKQQSSSAQEALPFDETGNAQSGAEESSSPTPAMPNAPAGNATDEGEQSASIENALPFDTSSNAKACMEQCSEQKRALLIGENSNAPSPLPSPSPPPDPSPSPSPINTAAADNLGRAREATASEALEARLTAGDSDHPALELADVQRLFSERGASGKSPIDAAKRQWRYWTFREASSNPKAMFLKAIIEDWGPPSKWLEAKKQRDEREWQKRNRELETKRREQEAADAAKSDAEFREWWSTLAPGEQAKAIFEAKKALCRNPAIRNSVKRCEAKGIEIGECASLVGVYREALRSAVLGAAIGGGS